MVDCETTGFSTHADRLVELAIVTGNAGAVIDRHVQRFDPQRPIPEAATAVHGISDDDVAFYGVFGSYSQVRSLLASGRVYGAYNASFDRMFLIAEAERAGWSDAVTAMRRGHWIDPLVWARSIYQGKRSNKLVDVAERLGVPLAKAHSAEADAEAALMVMYELGKNLGVPKGLGELLREQRRLQDAGGRRNGHRKG